MCGLRLYSEAIDERWINDIDIEVRVRHSECTGTGDEPNEMAIDVNMIRLYLIYYTGMMIVPDVYRLISNCWWPAVRSGRIQFTVQVNEMTDVFMHNKVICKTHGLFFFFLQKLISFIVKRFNCWCARPKLNQKLKLIFIINDRTIGGVVFETANDEWAAAAVFWLDIVVSY